MNRELLAKLKHRKYTEGESRDKESVRNIETLSQHAETRVMRAQNPPGATSGKGCKRPQKGLL